VSSWERERFLAGERGECRDTLVACVGERRWNGCGDGISLCLSLPCPRRDVRCPARAMGRVGNPRRIQSVDSFPELSKSAVPELAPVPRHLADSRASRCSREKRHLGSSVLPTRVTHNGSNRRFYSSINRRRKFPRFFFAGVLRYLSGNRCMSCALIFLRIENVYYYDIVSYYRCNM